MRLDHLKVESGPVESADEGRVLAGSWAALTYCSMQTTLLVYQSYLPSALPLA
jgi:hypothetical protein